MKEMKSYQHSNKSEKLKGVAGLNCVCESRFLLCLDSARLFPSSPRWMDGCEEGMKCVYVCMHRRTA
jgi:hypothetical protein